ncbi:MAG TPA: alkaline phosphatase D family protein [Noviherbaspirillum sp.]|uniref:alkaline phosphatase D family protein n=1 Tax=Noviherbaspirillum sp. TaxID=1926288 RepID=UPI002B47FF1C|nr:alkaline phosphatase D family protein [Noviherbaspirillum sp.]HJV84856.1 alkaline phosphatase D family protein [Noviherbaspirillum sp.]
MSHHRRNFLALSARLLTLAALSSAFPGRALSRTAAYPFSLGIASGSPRADRVVIWTRILPDPLDAFSAGAQAYAVQWEMAEDEAFTRIAAKGSATALPELAHSVHVDVAGLRPDRWYWYRFLLGDAVSPVGRTRTAPAQDAMPASLRLAFASCQHWEFGEYGAHRHIAVEAPDLVAFLGDYIYEWGPYDLSHPATPRRRMNVCMTLADYRARYAQYKSDPHLQASHRAAPWIVTWDDHEVANDYGNDRDELLDSNFLARRAGAYQAFYEHMPVRLLALPDGPQRFAHMQIYDRYDWGRLARFNMLDDRQYRSYHACQQPGRGGSTSVTSRCAERLDPARTLLGFEQESWLYNGFASSRAQWNFVAQQTLMAQASQVPVSNADDGRFWTDGWDGYPAARQRLFDNITRHRPANPMVLSGDVHTFYASDLKREFNHPVSPANPVIATEFCGTSVTSSSRPQSCTDQYVAQNPHIKFGRSDRRGYVMMEVTPGRAKVKFQALEDVHKADSDVSTIARFVVEDGRPGIVRDD